MNNEFTYLFEIDKWFQSMISVLCFSKDRPLQIEAYVRTFMWSLGEQAQLSVLYYCSEEKYSGAYAKLIKEFPTVHWLKEKNFRDQVKGWVEDNPGLVAFGCDDVIFREKVDVSQVEKVFEQAGLLGFSLRLGKDITFSTQYKNSVMRPLYDQQAGIITWDWQKAYGDWHYPFELCATVYRHDFVQQVLAGLDEAGVDTRFKTDDWGQPNRFEAMADKLVKGMEGLHSKMASFEVSRASTITVNRVQDVCDNQVFDESGEMSAEQMLKMWDEGVSFDFEAYRGRTFRCIHTGACFLKDKLGNPVEVGAYDIIQAMATTFVENVYAANEEIVLNDSFVSYMESFGAYISQTSLSWDMPLSFRPAFLKKPSDYSVITEDVLWQQWIKQNCANESWALLAGEEEVAKSFAQSCELDSNARNKTTFFEYETLGMKQPDVKVDAAVRKLISLACTLSSGSKVLLGVRSAPNATLCFDTFRIFSRDEILMIFKDVSLEGEFHISEEGTDFDDIQDYKYAYSFYLFHRK